MKSLPPSSFLLPPFRRGSILVIVMITLLFTVTALIAFMEKAHNDLAVDARSIVANRLRMEAYSAVEVTLAVLEDFRLTDSGLRSTSEGWGDPLGWAGWTPGPGHTVDISFEDESGKIPLVHADATILTNLFESWQMTETDAKHLSDVLLTWMQKNYISSTAFSPDYEQSPVPYDPPLRPLRSFSELASIDFAKDIFYDHGLPNDLWWRFYNDFSIFNYAKPDINGANADVMAAVGQFGDTQQQNVSSYLAGTGNYTTLGQQWFQDTNSLRGVVGAVGNPGAFGTTINALRIHVTVHEGHSQFHLSVVVASQGGARTVQTTATDMRKGASSSASGEAGSAATPTAQASTSQATASPTSAQTAAASAANLQYPFTVLEILENDGIPTPPPAPPPTSK